MNTKNMYHFLREMDVQGKWLFDFQDLRVWFEEKPTTIKRGLKRHISDGLILRITRGLYANAMPSCRPLYAAESLIPYLRPVEVNYESFESRLSALGIISQIPMRLTFATSGASGVFVTPVGTVEFTHVRLPDDLDAQILWDDDRQIWFASPGLAHRDLRKARRNLHLVDVQELREALGHGDTPG